MSEKKIMNNRKLEVWAPKTPGATESIVATCETRAEARAVAAEFIKGRRDLRMQDVYVRLGEKLIEGNLGPCR